MGQADYNWDALESCRSAVEGKAGPVGAIGDGFEGQHVDATMFGTLDSADALAQAVTEFDAVATEQFHAAEERLRSASGALDAVRTSMQDADDAAADSMRV